MSPFLLLGVVNSALKLLALAGGGGSSSGGGGFSSSSSSSSSYSNYSTGPNVLALNGPSLIFFNLVFFGGILLFVAYVIMQLKKQGRYTNLFNFKIRQVDDSKLNDNQKLAKDTLLRFQKDWSAFDINSMKTYMSESYFRHNFLMMSAMKLAARQNQVDNIKIFDVKLVNQTITSDSFTAAITISATDITNDTRTNRQLFRQRVRTVQFYKFKQLEGRYVLDGVDNSTQDPSQHVNDMQVLADTNGYFYSLDWGWLLLPTSGQLFKGGKFGVSDINNHVIGTIGQTIFQLYTYRPYSGNNSDINLGQYLVAQTAVPKDYGNIYIRPNKLIDIAPKGMTKVSLEWGDFNKKYDVFASDMERVTSFELLNPSFMEKIERLPFHLSIEVADNVVYLYSQDSNLGVEDYKMMLEILKEAFKEMRM